MRDKFYNFLFSYGPMLLAAVLLFLGPAAINGGKAPVKRLPMAGWRDARFGGDVNKEILPAIRPTVPLPKDKSEFSGGLTAASVLVLDDKTDTVLFGKIPTL